LAVGHQLDQGASSSRSLRHSGSSASVQLAFQLKLHFTTLNLYAAYYTYHSYTTLFDFILHLNNTATMSCGDIFLALIAVLFPPIAGTSQFRCLDHHVANIPLQQYGSKSASVLPTPLSISLSAASATFPASSMPGTSSPATLT